MTLVFTIVSARSSTIDRTSGSRSPTTLLAALRRRAADAVRAGGVHGDVLRELADLGRADDADGTKLYATPSAWMLATIAGLAVTGFGCAGR
ncbi:MAG: hypothetical protein R2752_15105 [Vicinamibacterales bacterium]